MTMTMTMTMTLREIQHLSMEAWPYRRECRGHDPAKRRISCTDEACSIGKVCTYTLPRTVCSTSNMRCTRKITQQNTGCCWNKTSNSNRWTPRILSNTTEKSGRPGGDGRAREARTKHTPEEEVGKYRSSSVTPVFQPNFLTLVREGLLCR